jgi:hypothetical protein
MREEDLLAVKIVEPATGESAKLFLQCKYGAEQRRTNISPIASMSPVVRRLPDGDEQASANPSPPAPRSVSSALMGSVLSFLQSTAGMWLPVTVGALYILFFQINNPLVAFVIGVLSTLVATGIAQNPQR